MRANHVDLPPPSVILAARVSTSPSPLIRERAYPLDGGYDDPLVVRARLGATRALLAATTPEQVAAILATFVGDLGGRLVPARLADSDAMPLDVSLGTGEPILPCAGPASVAGMRLLAVLPTFVEEARAVLQRLQGDARQAHEAEVDLLTGLLTRRAWMRRISSAREGDGVAMIDLDHFKLVNDTAGHAAGDLVLRAVGVLLREHFRGDDAVCRYGGDELACLTPGMSAQALVARLDDVRAAWIRTRPRVGQQVGLSVGVAAIGRDEPSAAVRSADRALYRAKAAGRGRTELATRADDGSTGA